ncbi:MAG: S9 family peptidase [Planctomycetota bacterium]|nr:S9 family peptidase [Planctomycetota bacterium]
MMRPIPPACTLFAVLALACPAQAREPIVTTDLLRLRTVSSIDVARDGSRAVLAVRSIGSAGSEDTELVNLSHLFLLDLRDDSAPPRQLTWGRRSDRAPVFAPDGTRIAFVRAPVGDDDAAAQVWVMPVNGGEARPVTDFPRGADDPRWSPDGRRLLVSSAVPMDELPGAPAWPSERPRQTWRDEAALNDVTPDPAGSRAQIRAWLKANADQCDPNLITRLEFVGETDLRGEMTFAHLFLVDPHDPDAEPRRLTSGFADHRDGVFMPDGESLLYTTKTPADRHPDRVRHTSIRRIDIDGTNDRQLLALDDFSVRQPRPSRDGWVVAFLAHQMDEPMFRQTRLGIVTVGEDGVSEPTWLTDEEAFDAPVLDVRWMPTRSALVFNSAVRGGYPLMTMGVGLLEPAVVVDELDDHPAGVYAFGIGGGAIVYAATMPANPCTVRVRDARGDRVAFDLNAWVADKELSVPEAGSVTRPDGVDIQYWLMPPMRREATKTYPLVLEIHGGPNAMWGPGERSMWLEFQLLCSWGYAVVYSNPRGSAGYGYEFERASFQNLAEGPAGDVLAVVDHALLNEWIDPERLLVTGGSYGGYLTAWIIAHDHRFKAAVAQRGVYHLTTLFGEGAAWRLVEWWIGGWPWEPRLERIYKRESPFSDVHRIRTPLLIIHGDRDRRTGFVQSEMLYRALKQLERPVEYVRYPGADHSLSRRGDPAQRMDRLNRIIDFFERHIDNPRTAPRAE